MDFGPGDPSQQVNISTGYRTSFGDAVGFDVMLHRYNYPGAGDMNFNELVTTTSFLDNYGVVLAYTNDGDGRYNAGKLADNRLVLTVGIGN